MIQRRFHWALLWQASFNGRILAFAGLWERWTIPDGIKLPRSLSDCAPGDAMMLQPVLTWVNKASNGDPRCVEAVVVS